MLLAFTEFTVKQAALSFFLGGVEKKSEFSGPSS